MQPLPAARPISRVGCPPWQWLVDPLSTTPRPTPAASSVPPTWMPMLSCVCRPPSVFVSPPRQAFATSFSYMGLLVHVEAMQLTAPCPSFLASSPAPATLLARLSGCSKTVAVYLARFRLIVLRDRSLSLSHCSLRHCFASVGRHRTCTTRATQVTATRSSYAI